MAVFQLLFGIVVLSVGAEILIRGAVALARAIQISPLVVGLTVVAFGTGAPELVVSLQATVRGHSDIALGNVLGSNIANVLLILGISAVITPLVVSVQLIRFEVPLMIAVSAVMTAFAWDGQISRVEGLMLFLGLLLYTTWSVRQSRREQLRANEISTREIDGEISRTSFGALMRHVFMVAVGLVLLIVGARWFSDAAVAIALGLGVSELVVGLTVVAIGTSMPEIATTLAAAIRGQRDIAVGNAVGSNLFNIMGVLGLSSIVSNDGIAVSHDALAFDIPIMLAVAAACLPVFFTGHRIARWEGAVFLGYYAAYTAYLIIGSEGTVGRVFESAMLGFVIPLTVLTMAVGIARSIRNRLRGSIETQN